MKDSFGRRIDYIRVSVTDRCNLRCIYCMPRKLSSCAAPSGEISGKSILRLIRVARSHGLSKVRLTGGEPLLRKGIEMLIREIKDLGVEDLSLTTNGTLLAGKARTLRAAGLDRINISLNTLNPRRYRFIAGGGSVGKVLNAIEEAEDAGLGPIKINFVPIRGLNDDEIVRFASLTKEKPYHVRFIELMPLGDGAWSRERRISADEVLSAVSSACGRLEEAGLAGSSRNYRLMGAKGIIGVISPMSRRFCASCNRLRLTSKGKLKACLFSGIEADIGPADSDEALEALMLGLIRCKPKERHEETLPFEAMSGIGG